MFLRNCFPAVEFSSPEKGRVLLKFFKEYTSGLHYFISRILLLDSILQSREYFWFSYANIIFHHILYHIVYKRETFVYIFQTQACATDLCAQTYFLGNVTWICRKIVIFRLFIWGNRLYNFSQLAPAIQEPHIPPMPDPSRDTHSQEVAGGVKIPLSPHWLAGGLD